LIRYTDAIVLLTRFATRGFPSAALFFFLFSAPVFSSCKSKKGAASSGNVSAQENNKKKKGKLTDEEVVNFKGHYLNACRQKALGNMELAEEQFKEALKINPDDAATKYELASIYKMSGLIDDALNFSRGAATAEPKNEWYQLLYIDCLHSKKFYSEAAAAYENLIDQHPGRLEYYNELAREYTYAGNYNKAIKTYDLIGEKFGKTADVYLNKIKLLKQQKKLGEAEDELKKLIQIYPKETNYYTYLAELYQDTNQDEKAMEIYKKLSSIDPDNPYVHLALADYYRSRQNDSAFLRELKVAFRYPELSIDQKVLMLMSFFTISDQYPEFRKDGLELCEIVVNVHPEEPKAHAVYGDYLYRERKLKESRDQYLEVLAKDKSKFAIWDKLMMIDTEIYDFRALELHGQEASDLFPSHPLPLYYSGIAKIQLKKYKEGTEQLLEAKEYVIDDNTLLTQIYLQLGNAYNYLKEYEKSDKAFEDALKLDPDNTQVMNNYSYFLSNRKVNLDRAEKLSARSNELEKKNPQFMDTYSWILYQQNKLSEAREWAEKALANGGEKNGVILEHYGDILFKLNETEKAMTYWKKAKETGRYSENLDKKINEKKLYE
jgi:tetratricopeptide (TPR) repeat protein